MVDCGDVTIEPATDPSQVTFDGCNVSAGQATTEDQIDVSFTLANANQDVDAMVDYEVMFDGQLVGQGSVTISPSGSASETVSVTPSAEGIAPGDYTVQVNVTNIEFGSVASHPRRPVLSSGITSSGGCTSCGQSGLGGLTSRVQGRLQTGLGR